MKYVASSISQMTDYDKYYVYTGHEEGMITGCWYFWSGTEWLIGGDYQCGIDDIIETSSTMDEEGMPADAKAVGDMIVVSNTEPTSPHTELWIDPDTESVLVPTMDDIEGTYAKKSEVESTYARKAAVGSPLRAATASAMTDVTKIYVYTGSESGYTAGHWYYYNGSSWADGGVYNSTAFVTDKTLTGDGEAADAKVTGDKITDLKSALSFTEEDVFEINEISIPITEYQKYISGTGNWYTNNTSSASDYFPVSPNQRVKLTGVYLKGVRCIAAYYADKSFASVVAGNTDDEIITFIVPENCYYIAVTAPFNAATVSGFVYVSSNIKDNTNKIRELENVAFNKSIQFFLTDIFRQLAWTITNGEGLIKSFEQITGNKNITIEESYDYTLVNGEYVTKTGKIEAYNSWSRSNIIPCNNVAFIAFSGNGNTFTTAGYSVFYDKDMNFISYFTILLDSNVTEVTIPVPQNANCLLISAATNQFPNLVSITPVDGE